MDLQSKVRAILSDLGLEQLDLETLPPDPETGSPERVQGIVLSSSFTGQDQRDRQERIWVSLESGLTSDEQRRVISLLTMTPLEVAECVDDCDVAEGGTGSVPAEASLPTSWRAHLASDPGTCGGQLRARGTRVLVTNILDSLAEGASTEEVLGSFPSLRPEHIAAALAYAAELVREEALLPLADPRS